MPSPRLMKQPACPEPLIVAVTVVLLTTGVASANSTGITGFSGEADPQLICNSCHSGGTAPVVEFEGPSQINPSETATFRFIVRSQSQQQNAAGFNVAVRDGTLGVVDGQGERLFVGELTHMMRKANVDGVASWEFTWEAPDAPGTYTLFGAGNSVNGDAFNFGDRAAATTFDVTVAEAADTPTPTPTPTPTVSRPPTNTRGPVPCVGDCDESGDVTVNELVRGVNILLEQATISQCPDFDTDGSDTVTINELVGAVNALLGGCQ